MQKPRCLEIWAVGNSEELLDRILEHVRVVRGNQAIIEAAEWVKVSWSDHWEEFSIERDRKGWCVKAPEHGSSMEIRAWNANLESFYHEAVEPLKDRIGGVAAGIGYREEPPSPQGDQGDFHKSPVPRKPILPSKESANMLPLPDPPQDEP